MTKATKLFLSSAIFLCCIFSRCKGIEEKYKLKESNTFSKPNPYEYWELVWNDEFNGSTIDTTKWNIEINGTGGGNNELQYYVASNRNSFLKAGCLAIKAIKEEYKEKVYTSARLNTKNKGDWTYGRFEVRAKLPTGTGVWPAIWLLPTDNEYGTWAASGEIDIMEIIGSKPDRLHGTIHFGGTWPDNRYSGGVTQLKEGTLSSDFHTYTVEWKPNEIKWFIDDKIYHTENRGKPLDKRFYMILNLAIGGDWPGSPDETTKFPSYMFVDYVRVYKHL